MKASPVAVPFRGAKKNSPRPPALARAVAVACITMTTLAACGSGGGLDEANPEAVAAAKAAAERTLAGHASGNTESQAPSTTEPIANDGPTNRADTPDDRESIVGRVAGGDEDGPGAGSSDTVAAVNRVDTLISDMDLMNDITLKGVNASHGFATGPGHVIMGNNPRGTNTPDWYKRSYPWLATDSYWNYLLPWFVHFEGEGNQASNTRIEMRNMRVFMKRRSNGEWSQVNRSQSVGAIECAQASNYFECPLSGDVRKEAEGVSALPLAGHNLHGWWGSREYVEGWDIAAVVVTLQARLGVHATNGVDDRSKARYLVQVGADYYPSDGSPEAVLPAVGISRAKLLTSEWQSISMTTLSDVGKQEPGGGITAAELRASPPPLD